MLDVGKLMNAGQIHNYIIQKYGYTSQSLKIIIFSQISAVDCSHYHPSYFMLNCSHFINTSYNLTKTHINKSMQSTTQSHIQHRTLQRTKQPILYFLTTPTHLIYLTYHDIRVLPLADGQQAHCTQCQINTSNIVKIEVQKNNSVAILYINHILQIRDAKHISQVLIQHQDIYFTSQDVKLGFPKLYFKDNDLFLLNRDRLEAFHLRAQVRQIHTQFMKQVYNEEIIQNIAFSNLMPTEKIALIQFQTRLTFSFFPISITEIPRDNVTAMKILSTPQFASLNQQDLLLRQYLVLITNNTTLEVFNLISMKKLIEIPYNIKKEQSIQITTDDHNNFLLVTIYRLGNTEIKENILYRVNVEYYYMPTSQYFKEQEPFFDLCVTLDFKHPLKLLTEVPKKIEKLTNIQKISSLKAAYFQQKQSQQKKQNKKGYKTKFSNEKQYEISIIQIDLKGFKSYHYQEIKQSLIYPSTRLKKEWGQLRQWKDMILSYIEMRYSLNNMNLGFVDKPIQKDDESYFRDDSPKQKGKTSILPKDHNPYDYKLYSEKLGDLQEAVESKNQSKIEAVFLKFMKEYLNQQNLLPAEKYSAHTHEDDFQQFLEEKPIRNSGTKTDQTGFNTPKYSQTSSKLSNAETAKPKNTLFKGNNNSINRGDYLNRQEAQSKQEKEIKQEVSPQFSATLKAIEDSIHKGLEPLSQKLCGLDSTIDTYQSKNNCHLSKYSKSLKYGCNYSQNIQGSIKNYCSELMNQFTGTLQDGIDDYCEKISGYEANAKKQRQKTIYQFKMYIDEQIQHRSAIFDENRNNTDHDLREFRKILSQTKEQPKRNIKEKSDEEFEEEWQKTRERRRGQQQQNTEAMSLLFSLLNKDLNLI